MRLESFRRISREGLKGGSPASRIWEPYAPDVELVEVRVYLCPLSCLMTIICTVKSYFLPFVVAACELRRGAWAQQSRANEKCDETRAQGTKCERENQRKIPLPPYRTNNCKMVGQSKRGNARVNASTPPVRIYPRLETLFLTIEAPRFGQYCSSLHSFNRQGSLVQRTSPLLQNDR